MDISSFPLFFFFFSVVCFLQVHGQLPLPTTEQPITDHSAAIHHHQVYIVHVLKTTAKKFHLFKQRKDWYKSFLPNDTLFSGEPRLVYAYRQVITGFAAWLTQGELKAMESMDGFLLANQNFPLHHRTTYTPEFLGLDRSQGMWYETAYGQGQIIGVIDSGVKPTHPSFSGHAMPPAPTKWSGTCFWGKPICNNKLIGAEGSRRASPIDTEGHGSHCAGVASIAAGNFVDGANVHGEARGTASGIAPKAHLAVYKNAGAGDLLKSIEDAMRGHVDVLSISQGDSPDFYTSGIVKGAFAAVTKNIVTVVAAPNSGPTESSMQTDAPWMITVGAASTDRRIMTIVKLGDEREFLGESAYQPSDYDSPILPLIYLFRCFGEHLIDND
ncbi:subtilisin-like protease SBT1.2, partial [Phalaenopsis equestris]|uniref:subtilisin-like protease SBT1.2 n=1 Tax=Phalaenopsis equestris TaxID=78828 RepID=UPI0009E471BC